MCTKQERPFGSVNVAAELAATMGLDPRPHMSEAEIERQLQISGKTRAEWDAAWDRRLEQQKAPF